MLINPAIDGKNLTRHVVGMDPCQWIKKDLWEDWDPEVQWKPESKQSPGYNLLLESCRKVYQFEAIRATLEHLQQKLDNIITACGISNYSDSDFKDEFTYLRHNGIEGAKILIVQRMLATMGVDVEQHMVAKKSDDGEQLENERKLAMLKFTVARFCENHEWHMVPEMRESDMRQKIESSLNDVVDGIPPLSDDVLNEKMQRERERESMDHSDREAFRRDGNATVPIHFPSIREQSTMSVKQLQQLACNMRPGENLPQEDVQEQLMAHMAQVLHGGKLIVTAKILEGKIQFLFGNAKSMAQIVGVGLDFATVSLTRQNVIVVEGITELEWTRLWGEVFLGESLFENPIFMEKVVFSPPVHEKPQGSHVNALSKVAMFFMIQKFLQNLDVGKVYNQVVRGVATTMTEENQPDIGQVHAKSVNDPSTGILGFNLWDYFSRLQITRGLGNDPSTGILGFNLWDYFSRLQIMRCLGNDPSTGVLGFNLWDYLSRLQITRGLGSATRDTSGEGGSHLGGRDTPSEGDKDQGGDGGEDDDNRKGRGAKGKEIQQNNQQGVLVTVYTGYEHGVWNRNPVPEQVEGSDIDPIPEQLKESYISPTLELLFKKAESAIESDVLVDCSMKKKGSRQDSERFGWFQYKLHVSFKCLEPDAAILSSSEILGSQILKETYMEQVQPLPFKLALELGGGAPGIASGKATLTKSLASTSKLYQRLIELAPEFISGTRFCVDRGDGVGSTPMLEYDFKLWPEVPTDTLPDGSDMVKHKGMFSTVSPNVKANWTVLSQNVCQYELEVERHACELVLVAGKPKTWWGRGKQNLSCDCNKMVQTYRVILYINHNMSHIETLAEFERRLWKGNPTNKLVGLGMPPSSPASDEASSSTQ